MELSDVRPARPEDEEALVGLCRLHHAETALPDFPFSEECVRAMLQRALIKQRNDDVEPSFCGVIGTPDDLQASIYLTQSKIWYSSKPILKEVFAIVAPAYRKTSHARSLAAWSKIAAACVDQVLIAEVTAQRIEAKERFYARSYGAERFGAFYAFDPTPGA
jgi:hypothetical protein